MIEHHPDPAAGVQLPVGDEPDRETHRVDIRECRHNVRKAGGDLVGHDGETHSLAHEFPGDDAAWRAETDIGFADLQPEGAQIPDQFLVVVETD